MRCNLVGQLWRRRILIGDPAQLGGGCEGKGQDGSNEVGDRKRRSIWHPFFCRFVCHTWLIGPAPQTCVQLWQWYSHHRSDRNGGWEWYMYPRWFPSQTKELSLSRNGLQRREDLKPWLWRRPQNCRLHPRPAKTRCSRRGR